MDIEITKKQERFINANADEVLFGGAAGGGKSYGQVVDAFLYALKYPKSKQIIFRRTFPELDKSIIRTVLNLYPQSIFTYNSSNHTGKFKNGSILDFGYCDSEKDVYKYQSAEFDVIRFDELTHFTEDIYIYLISRLRGANDFPKSVKSSTNPGGVGHNWVKERFIDIGQADEVHRLESGTRIFIPSKVQDNTFLMEKDKDYIKRLENLDEKNKKALLYGDWDIFDGQYFEEFKRDIHVIKPFEIPNDWRVYRSIDYGLDCFACVWVALNSIGEMYVFREYAKSDRIISDGCRDVIDMTKENVYTTYAPPDLWSRSQESGKSRAELFRKSGLLLQKSSNDRVSGWMCLKELFKGEAPRLKIFSSCNQLIKCISAIQHDENKPDDCAVKPHDITHLPDALRYFAVMHNNIPKPINKNKNNFTFVGDNVTKYLRRD
ncbi:MAG: phage terminase large subunit [Clostridia bacterium]|nr:phage terminase large subunit [Clostridia bacterium]